MTATVTNLENERTIRDGEAAVKLYKSAKNEARAQILPMAMGLLAARQHYSADQAFSEWLANSPYNEINYTDRAALINIGDNAQIALSFLQTTILTSPRRIWQALQELPSVSPQVKHPEDEPSSDDPKTTEDKPPTINKLKPRRKSSGKRSDGREKVKPISPSEMPSTMQLRYEAALKKAKEEIRSELKAEVQAIWDGIISHYTKKLEQADKIVHGFRGFIPREQFRMILACLHPDANKFERAAEMFQLFQSLEIILVKLDPPINAPPLPKTAAELMARRKKPV